MRIQHNIMAMNAYRNYNLNNKALSGNLEKLSSGYKINRAGDDAAGLAISEKMRAQITGLNAAQKNVKDGISLVKTAEGAMQEIQDMLNRMDYLATQSANGTYDNEVDRANLQKEVKNLKTEINRIADSANFNGIKLLDGSLDANTVKGGSPAVEAVTDGKFDIPATGTVLGKDTILHQDEGVPGTTTFSVDLHDVKFSNGKNEKLTIDIGGTKIEIAGKADGTGTELDASDIITALTSATAPTNVGTITGVTAGNPATVKINGQDFKLSDGTNGRLTFTQVNAPTTESEVVDGNMSVTITGTGAPAVADVYKSGALTQGGTAGAKDTTVTVNYTDKDGKAQSKDVTFKSGTAVAATATAFITAVNADADLKDLFTAAGDNTGITFTSKVAGANLKVTGLDVKTAGDDTVAIAGGTHATSGADVTKPVTGDWNMQTTDVTSVGLADVQRLASTVIQLKDTMVADGNSVTIGNVDYTFTTDATKKDTDGMVYIGDMVGEGKTLDMDKVHERLSAAAADNETWTVSANAGKGITLVEKTDANGDPTGNDTAEGNNGIDLSTEEGIMATLGFKTQAKDAVPGTPGKPLTLQIGDTSDPFNQMEISVGDMHVSAMFGLQRDEDGNLVKDADGNTIKTTDTIESIDIGTQEGAAKAVNVIKDAINYVSSIRGDLGAIQNRLDHTANNLSVMAENIQDAESTIRDTDVAEEMMSYVKNNILVQSAQAMLAQANQVPQGVLQLLG